MSRRRSSRLAPEVIELLDSSSDEDEPRRQPPPLPQRGSAGGGGGGNVATKEGGGNQLPKSIQSSPVSNATNTSNNPLANLLASASTKPPGSIRPPLPQKAKPSRKTTGEKNNSKEKSTTTAAGDSKRKNLRERTIPEDTDLDFIDSPAALQPQLLQNRNGNKGGGDGNSNGSTNSEMWSLKYEPHTPADLIVHKKKVEEVNLWLQIQRHAAGSHTPPACTSRLLIVTGPPGCGKTVTLRVLGESLGFTITEWQAQAEASYQEITYLNNIHNSSGGSGSGGGDGGGGYEERLQYVSKIAAFEEFASRAKMAALPLSKPTTAVPQSPSSNSIVAPTKFTDGIAVTATTTTTTTNTMPLQQRPTMVFIDDLPFTSDPEQRRRLARAVSNLARCARFPVVLFATEASGRSQQDKVDKTAPGGLPRELSQALEAVPGVPTISFNAITPLNTAKVLKNILRKENRFNLMFSENQVVAIAEQAGGDLRNAINSLQFAYTGVVIPLQQHLAVKQPAAKRQRGGGGATASAKNKNKKIADVTEKDVDKVSFMLRDTSLSLFHGLGKLLYNKRLLKVIDTADADGNEEGASPGPSTSATAAAATTSLAALMSNTINTTKPVPCLDWLQRGPMDGFEPNDVLTASGLEATSVNAFLHENILDFIQDSEIFDVAACLSQLSTSDVLSSTGRRRFFDSLAAGDDAPGGATIADACAAMVAARGVCFWNTHPAPRQWHPLRAPALFTVHRGMLRNSEELHEAAGVGRIVYGGSGGLDSASLLATELLPAVRAVCQNIRLPYSAPTSLIYQQPAKWTTFWNGKLHQTVFHAGVGGRGAVIDVENAHQGGGGGGGGGGSVVQQDIEEDPIVDSDDDI